jgi:hypothetical protein
MRKWPLALVPLALVAAGLLLWRHVALRDGDPAVSSTISLVAGLPEVAGVESAREPDRAGSLVLHVRDLHLVPRDLFVQDSEGEAGRQLSAAGRDRLWSGHLDAVEAVQKEQANGRKGFQGQAGEGDGTRGR